MRKKKESQLNLLNLMPRNKIARELEAVSQVLDANQDILDLVYGDPVKYRRTPACCRLCWIGKDLSFSDRRGSWRRTAVLPPRKTCGWPKTRGAKTK